VSSQVIRLEVRIDDDCRLEWWSQRNQCTGKTVETSHGGKVHHYSWTCDGRDGLLQHYKINEMSEWKANGIT